MSLFVDGDANQFEVINNNKPTAFSTFSPVQPSAPSSTAANNRNNWLNSFKQTVARHAEVIAEEGELSSARTTPSRPKMQPVQSVKQVQSKSTLLSTSQDELDDVDVSSSSDDLGLQDTLLNLLSSLEDVQGAYTETEQLQHHVSSLLRTLRQVRVALDSQPSPVQKGHKRQGSTCSDVSVESALGCFDFLNSETISHVSSGSSQHATIQPSGSAQSTPERSLASVLDSGCGPSALTSQATDEASTSFMTSELTPAKRRQCSNGVEETPTSCASPSVAQLTTGSEQLDAALAAHLTYCQKLLENLGSFGPLRSREAQSLRKLQQQSALVGKLYRLTLNVRDHLHDGLAVGLSSSDILRTQKLKMTYSARQDRELHSLKEDARLRKLWDTVCYQHSSPDDQEDLVGLSQLLVVSSSQFAASLQAYMRSFVSPTTTALGGGTLNHPGQPRSPMSGEQTAAKVSKLIAARVTDSARFEPDTPVSFLQLAAFFRVCPASDLEGLFAAAQDEIALLDALGSADAVQVKRTLSKLARGQFSPGGALGVPREPLFQAALLLLDDDALVARLAETFFVEFSVDKNQNFTKNKRELRSQVS